MSLGQTVNAPIPTYQLYTTYSWTARTWHTRTRTSGSTHLYLSNYCKIGNTHLYLGSHCKIGNLRFSVLTEKQSRQVSLIFCRTRKDMAASLSACSPLLLLLTS